mmetsp:Transcript_15643/g.37169  ORF Transcript_15643/g.37169 Transcript_15643/m.37169 type:complete len:274 (+) Transcript_15643:829-1650(+)
MVRACRGIHGAAGPCCGPGPLPAAPSPPPAPAVPGDVPAWLENRLCCRRVMSEGPEGRGAAGAPSPDLPRGLRRWEPPPPPTGHGGGVGIIPERAAPPGAPSGVRVRCRFLGGSVPLRRAPLALEACPTPSPADPAGRSPFEAPPGRAPAGEPVGGLWAASCLRPQNSISLPCLWRCPVPDAAAPPSPDTAPPRTAPALSRPGKAPCGRRSSWTSNGEFGRKGSPASSITGSTLAGASWNPCDASLRLLSCSLDPLTLGSAMHSSACSSVSNE